MTRRNRSASTEQTEDDLVRVPSTSTSGWNAPVTKDPLSSVALAGRSKARKDTKKWCRGKEGREHALAIVLDERLSWTKTGCGWVSYRVGWRKGGRVETRWRYSCHHLEACTVCGRHFRSGWDLGEECPLFVPLSVDERNPSA